MSAWAAEPAPRPVRIGTVNIVRVFDELEEKVDMNSELRQLEEKRANRLKQLDDQIRELEKTAKLLRPDSEEAKNNAKLMEDASREFRSYRDASEDHIYGKLYDFTLGIYRKIRGEVEAYGREANYDIVLRTRDADVGELDKDLRPRTRFMELQQRIDAQGVLYHSPALDFTEAIVKRVNDKYARTKAERERLQPPKPPAAQPSEPGKEKGKEKDSDKEKAKESPTK